MQPGIVVRDGLRWVEPYAYRFLSHAKASWVGRPLAEAVRGAFAGLSDEYLRDAARRGAIQLNGEPVSLGEPMAQGDLLTHDIVRVEIPAPAVPIPIVHDRHDVVAVDKPAGITTHPTGGYRKNSAVKMLAEQYRDAASWRLVHRLDLATSGALVFGRTRAAANVLASQIARGLVDKVYVARVRGDLGAALRGGAAAEGVRVTAVPTPPSLGDVARRHWGAGPAADVAEQCSLVEAPLGHVAGCPMPVTGVGTPGAREAATMVAPLAFDPATGTSLALCRPLTGRTHQIRVHLHALGCPVEGDPFYDGVAAQCGVLTQLVIMYDAGSSRGRVEMAAAWRSAGDGYPTGTSRHLAYAAGEHGPTVTAAAPPEMRDGVARAHSARGEAVPDLPDTLTHSQGIALHALSYGASPQGGDKAVDGAGGDDRGGSWLSGERHMSRATAAQRAHTTRSLENAPEALREWRVETELPRWAGR